MITNDTLTLTRSPGQSPSFSPRERGSPDKGVRGLSIALAVFLASAAHAAPKNPDTYTYATISDADTLDPAWAYDTASHSLILNVYEPLFFFDRSSTDKLLPLVAAKVPRRENGLISADGRTYAIPIRKGIRFHDGTPLTAEDVRYSLQRFMLVDRDAGPSWMLLEPLLGYHSTRDEQGKIRKSAFQDAARAVSVEGDRVILRLPRPYAPLLTVLAHWAAIVPRAWVAKNGGWDGSEAAWERFNNPEKQSSPLYERAVGSGAFRLERWDRRNKEIVLARNDAYWRAPAKLKRVLIKSVNEFGTRKLMLQAGDADAIYASEPERRQLDGVAGVRIIDGLRTVESNPVAFFTFKLNPVGNPNIGSGRLDGRGIPPDFFGDPDVRKGFAYSFDYPGFFRDVFRSKGTPATGFVPSGLFGHNPAQPRYAFDLGKAAEHLRKAWHGQAWDKGFQMTLTYNVGNPYRQTVCQILKRTIEGLNPKFRIDVRPVEWPTFLDAYQAGKLPLFVLGWQADFPDPHTFAFPMMHSAGDYPKVQKYKNPEVDRLIDEAVQEHDVEKRRRLYFRLQAIEHDDVPHLLFVDATRYRTERDWVHGFYHNPIFPDSPYSSYFYAIYKE